VTGSSVGLIVGATAFLAGYASFSLLSVRVDKRTSLVLDTPISALAALALPYWIAAIAAAAAHVLVSGSQPGAERVWLTRLGEVARRQLCLALIFGFRATISHAVALESLPGVYLVGYVFGTGAVCGVLDLFIGLTLARAGATTEAAHVLDVNVFRLALNLTGQLSLAAVMAALFGAVGAGAVVVILPLVFLMRASFNLLLRADKSYGDTILALARAVEMERPTTVGHGERTAIVADILGRRLGLRSQQLQRLRYAALLHDIGKLGCEESDGSLPDGIADHAERGANIVSKVDFLSTVAEPVRLHHGGESVIDSEVRGGDALLAQVVALASFYDHLVPEGAIVVGAGFPSEESIREALTRNSEARIGSEVLAALFAALPQVAAALSRRSRG
jgi:putative nucleotidyltransferase with HDIG domain